MEQNTKVEPINIQDRIFNVVASELDERDRVLSAELTLTDLPLNYPGIKVPNINTYDQKNTQMCLAFAIRIMKEIQEYKQRGSWEQFSAGFIYTIRTYTNSVTEGLTIRDTLKDLKSFGIAKYYDFPHIGEYGYLKSIFDNKVEVLKASAIAQAIDGYVRLRDTVEIKTMIMKTGAVIGAYLVYDEFMNVDSSGVIQNVKSTSKQHGGHGVVITGWKIIKNKLHWISPSTYGSKFGDNGYVYIPYDYLGTLEHWGTIDGKVETNEDVIIKMVIGDTKITKVIGDSIETIISDLAPFIDPKSSRTVLPVRAIAETLGGTVDWDNETKTVTLTFKRTLTDYSDILNKL